MVRIAVFVVVILCSAFSWAEEELVFNPTVDPKIDKGLEDGWHYSLVTSNQFAFSSSSDVVGQQNGDTVSYSMDLSGSARYRKERHALDQELLVDLGTSRTPAVSQFIKSSDQTKYETIYRYQAAKGSRLSYYVLGRVKTSLFYGEDVRSTDTDYVISYRNGSQQTLSGLRSLRLTEGLRPTTYNESLGLSWSLIEKKTQKLNIRLGIGFLQTATNGQFSIDDDADTDQVEVTELESYSLKGVETAVRFNGNWDEASGYQAQLDFFYPIDPVLEPGESAINLAETEFKLKLFTKYSKWLQVNYDFNLKNQPQVVDRVQVQQGISVAVNFELL